MQTRLTCVRQNDIKASWMLIQEFCDVVYLQEHCTQRGVLQSETCFSSFDQEEMM